MASERVIAILKTKGAPFTEQQLAEMSDKDGWKWFYVNCRPKGPRRPPDTRPAVCFTGLVDAEAPTFRQTAEQAGFRVVGSVSGKVVLLVAGLVPGPVKTATAKALGIPIVTAEDFLQHAAELSQAAVSKAD